MRNFRQFLTEEVIAQNVSGRLYLTERNVVDGHFEDDFSNVDVDGDVVVHACDLLKDLTGSPRSCLDYKMDMCPSLSSLQGGTSLVKGKVAIWGGQKLTSLAGVGKDYFREVRETFQVPTFVRSNILGLLRVKRLRSVIFAESARPPADFVQCVVEINKQLEGNRDIIECKEAMIALGQKEYAKL